LEGATSKGTVGGLLLGVDLDIFEPISWDVRDFTISYTDKISQKWYGKFNEWVEIWSLLEIEMGNRLYTWTNNQADPIQAT
jgi:hypothetical protein